MSHKPSLPDRALDRLGTLVSAVEAAEAANIEWPISADIYFLRNYTTEPIDPYLKFVLMQDDIQATITHGGYGTMAQEVLDNDSRLNSKSHDVIVLTLLLDTLDRACGNPDWTADTAIERLSHIMSLLLDNCSSLIVADTFLASIDRLLADEVSGDHQAEVGRINSKLNEVAASNSHRLQLVDLTKIYEQCSGVASLDARFWQSSQAPFRHAFLKAHAQQLAKFVRALKGRTKKCLVLDCDNTLWGGVVGEDGVDGIALDAASVPGRYFYEFQNAVIDLKNRGVLLAICSKNNEEDVLQVFDQHNNCPLDRSHFVTWRINWQNKAQNLVSIAEELNIGTDSLVMVEDSPQECALINKFLPEVRVLAVPEDLERYPNLLADTALFDSTVVSDEDRRRTDFYQEERRRRQQRSSFADLTAYLKSLETVIQINEARGDELPRIAQLTQKTNQFNLTTRRYTEAEIRRLAEADDSAVFAMHVSDRFGDAGLTGVMIVRRDGDCGIIDTLLLSCRVLSRQLEFAFVDRCKAFLEKKWKLTGWRAEYLPTHKNAQVADFWDRAGFERKSENGDGIAYVAGTGPVPQDYEQVMLIEVR